MPGFRHHRSRTRTWPALVSARVSGMRRMAMSPTKVAMPATPNTPESRQSATSPPRKGPTSSPTISHAWS